MNIVDSFHTGTVEPGVMCRKMTASRPKKQEVFMAYEKRALVFLMVLLVGFTPPALFAGGGQEEAASPLTGECVDLEGESIEMAILGIGG